MQVVNTNLEFANPLPAGQAVALFEQTAHLIRAADGLPVAPLEVYLHHVVTMDTLIVPPLAGQGQLVRQAFPEPYKLVAAADQLRQPAKRCACAYLCLLLPHPFYCRLCRAVRF